MDIQAVREGLAAAASAVVPRSFDYVPDSISPPVFFVESETVTFDSAMGRALDEAVFQCVLLVSMGANRSGQEALSPYLSGSGTKSLKVALEAARGAPGQPALDGAADDFRVESLQGHQVFDMGATTYWAATFNVRVWG